MLQESGTIGHGLEGLGAEKNGQIAEYLQTGNFSELLDMIANEQDQEKACEVVLNSSFDFNPGSREDVAIGLTQTALDSPSKFGDAMKALVKYSYKHNATTERFWKNPSNEEVFFIDGDGELISCVGETDSIAKGIQGEGERYIKTLTSYKVITGPNAGKKFDATERPVPDLK